MDLKKYKFLDKLAALSWVEQIWLFGSRARGDGQARADIDIAILCPQASIKDWSNLMQIIDDADTLLCIDCVRIDDLENNSELRKAIIKEGVLLYEKPKN